MQVQHCVGEECGPGLCACGCLLEIDSVHVAILVMVRVRSVQRRVRVGMADMGRFHIIVRRGVF